VCPSIGRIECGLKMLWIPQKLEGGVAMEPGIEPMSNASRFQLFNQKQAVRKAKEEAAVACGEGER
jgi:hypothetical protein